MLTETALLVYCIFYYINRLIFSTTSGFDFKVTFCYFWGRDGITEGNCDKGWKYNFELYGGTKHSKNTIKIFKYWYKRAGYYSTNLFSKEVSEHIQNLSIDANPIFVPGTRFHCKLGIDHATNL